MDRRVAGFIITTGAAVTVFAAVAELTQNFIVAALIGSAVLMVVLSLLTSANDIINAIEDASYRLKPPAQQQSSTGS